MQSTYPTYRHGKACLSKQPPWRAAGDPRLARGRSRVRTLGPAGALRVLFSPPSLPPSGDSFFRTFPTNPAKVLGLLCTTGMVYNNPNTIKSYKILHKLSPKHAAHGVAQSTYPPIGTGRLACLNSPLACSWGPSPSTQQVTGSSPGRAARAFFLHPPFLPPSGDSFFAPSPPTLQKC